MAADAAELPPNSDEESRHLDDLAANFYTLVFITPFIVFFIVVWKPTTFPTFKIESLSFSVPNTTNHDSSRVTAQWELGFSVENFHDDDSFGDLSSWLRCTTPQWSGNSVIALHKEEHGSNKAFGNVSFDTCTEDYIESKVLGCDVTFKGYYDDKFVITAECNNVTVEIEGGCRGIMIGGPKSSHGSGARARLPKWSGKSGIALHKELGHKAFGNVSFHTPWAREDFESKVLGCEVTFKGNYDENVIMAECKNVTTSFPTFTIETLSVSVPNNTATARWDLGFSVKNIKLHNDSSIGDLSAWLGRCTGPEWLGKSGIALHEGFGNVSFDAPWAREDYIESKVLGCDVTFNGYYKDN
ncbi:TCP family transcription factor [Striga asiatica]|uniref:TCP family transcription factor n=1 Tax=Striga asiatica TaxID=4170 RepID=A0A5A7RB17_STRAF|nr:TCP family transcription factor [Striga asiatica]